VPQVAKLLAVNGISAASVVDKSNRVIGMLSEGDLFIASKLALSAAAYAGSKWLHRRTSSPVNISSRTATKLRM
jgi:hypothetical protein